jgi:nitrate reductase gamma subunit
MHTWIDVLAAYLVRGAALVLFAGICWRLARWLRTPSPRQVVLTPAPTTRIGVALLMLHESVLFTTLFKASRWTWLFSWLFHFGLALVLLQHLRYVTAAWWGWISWLASWGYLASAMMLFGLLGLSARRIFVDRMRFISRVSDHAILALIAAIVVTGLGLKYFWPVNVFEVKDFVRGAVLLGDAESVPLHLGFLVHSSLALMLIVVFPFGKLMHGVGLWINPTRAQADRGRGQDSA